MEAVFSVLVRLGIVALTCALCYVIMKNAEPFKTNITSTQIPLIVIAAIAFTISSFFVSLYSEAMSSIYVSYLADAEAGGSVDQDKAPQELKEFLADAKR